MTPPPPPSSAATASFNQASSAYLTHLVAAAIAAPAAASDPSSAVVVSDLLVALARTEDHRAVAAVLAPRHGGDATFELRSYVAGTVVPAQVRHLDDGAQAVLAALEQSADPNRAVEVVSHDGTGLSRCVLTRAPGGPLRFRFPDLTAYDRGGDEDSIRRAVEGWRSSLRMLADVVVGAKPSAPAEPPAGSPVRPETTSAAALQQVAEAVVQQLVHDRRAPRAHDVADTVAPLIPTAAEVAEQVQDRLAPALASLVQVLRQPAAAEPEGTIERLEGPVDQLLEVTTTLQSQVQGLTGVIEALGERLAGAVETWGSLLREEVAAATRQQALDREAVHRQLRQLQGLRASVDVLATDVAVLRGRSMARDVPGRSANDGDEQRRGTPGGVAGGSEVAGRGSGGRGGGAVGGSSPGGVMGRDSVGGGDEGRGGLGGVAGGSEVAGGGSGGRGGGVGGGSSPGGVTGSDGPGPGGADGGGRAGADPDGEGRFEEAMAEGRAEPTGSSAESTGPDSPAEPTEPESTGPDSTAPSGPAGPPAALRPWVKAPAPRDDDAPAGGHRPWRPSGPAGPADRRPWGSDR